MEGTQILRESIAGACLLVSLGALMYVHKLLQKSQEDRIQELKDSGKMAVAMVEKLAPLVERLLEQEDRRR